MVSYATQRDHHADGVVRYAIGQETGQPGNHLLVMQFRTPEHYARVRATAIPTVMQEPCSLGATYHRFYGQTLLELDRDNPPPPSVSSRHAS